VTVTPKPRALAAERAADLRKERKAMGRGLGW
jgi:hypothetical protein